MIRKTAIVLGATGLTGSYILNFLLMDDDYDYVKVFTREKLDYGHPKMDVFVIDLLKLSDHTEKFTGDVMFCCIGTTKAKTPDRALYRAIDYGIPVEAAKIAKQKLIDHFIVISALGANPDSKIFYNKVKGEMERDVLAQQIDETHLLRPSLIVGNRREKRLGEDIARVVMKLIGFLMPDRYKMIHAKTIARAMLQLARFPSEEPIIPSEKIKELAHEYKQKT